MKSLNPEYLVQRIRKLADQMLIDRQIEKKAEKETEKAKPPRDPIDHSKPPEISSEFRKILDSIANAKEPQE